MNRARLARSLARLVRAPIIAWVLLGFALPYLAFFIAPTFLSGRPTMAFPVYVPVITPIGSDLRTDLREVSGWFVDHRSPYLDADQYAYPPLTLLLFAPLLLVSAPAAYTLVTLLTVTCAVVAGLLLPFHFSQPRPLSAPLLLAFLTGLFSFGFQFELERGQFNLIAVTLSLLALWIFHTHPRWRYLAYALFCVSVQLKLYPFIFVVLFVRDWRAWRSNLQRVVALSALNVAALFVLGPQLAWQCLAGVTQHVVNPYIWPGNHSIRSFVDWAFDRLGWPWLTPWAGLLQNALLAVVAGCLGLLLLQAYRRRQAGLNPWLLLGCALAALVIPATSHDYTLSFLVAPVALLFAHAGTWAAARPPRRQAVINGLGLLFSAAYATTLFPITHKPTVLHNNFPVLLLMLLTATALALISHSSPSHSDYPPPASAGPAPRL